MNFDFSILLQTSCDIIDNEPILLFKSNKKGNISAKDCFLNKHKINKLCIILCLLDVVSK